MPTRLRIAVVLLLAAPLWVALAAAQEATEQFIPVGQSPGLSGETLMGRVEAADATRGVVTVATSYGMREVAVNDATRVWLDRTEFGRTNTQGTLADCRRHLTVEVKLDEDGATADWIKVQMAPAPGT